MVSSHSIDAEKAWSQGLIQGWHCQLQRAEVREQGLRVSTRVGLMMSLEFCLDERRSELGVSGWAEKWLPYWVLGLQFVTALEYLIALVLESERKGWRGGRGTSLMSLAPQWLRVQCGWLFPWLSQPHPRVHWVYKWLHLSIAKWKFLLKDTETFSYFGVMTFFLIAFYYGMFKYIHEWGEQDSEPQVSITHSV